MQEYDWLVVGGGFQGIIAASLLSKKQKNIAIVERSPALGGVLCGMSHNGLVLDFGCHLFNNEEASVTQAMLEILGEDYYPVEVQYAGVTEDKKLEGMAVPSFAYLPEAQKKQAFDEIFANALEREKNPDIQFNNLKEWMLHHYGVFIGEKVAAFLTKLTTHHAENLSADSIYKTQLPYIHLIEDEDFLLPLKQKHPELDKVLALPSQGDRMRFYRDAEKSFEHRNFYPKNEGMQGFANAAQTYFKGKNIELLMGDTLSSMEQQSEGGVILTLQSGEKIKAQKVVWTLEVGLLSQIAYQENPLEETSLKVPMTLFYYFLPKGTKINYTYTHNFSNHHKSYRISAPGFYGHQYNDKGQSYICAEVPAQKDSDIWQNPEKYKDEIWQEVKEMGMVEVAHYEEAHQVSAPASYPLTTPEYPAFYQALSKKIEADYPDLINLNMNAYSKIDIVRKVTQALDAALKQKAA